MQLEDSNTSATKTGDVVIEDAETRRYICVSERRFFILPVCCNMIVPFAFAILALYMLDNQYAGQC